MTTRPKSGVFTIVIPALNEQEAIGDTIQRCLDARTAIVEGSFVEEVEVIVVSDGSTDETESIAKSFEEATVLAFERNRGYGAAIKCGFDHGRGRLLGFLDADGTCDPLFFADLCRAVDEQGVDVALGARMGPDSEMPAVRRLGNRLFGLLLGLLSGRDVTDTASGMRVISRDSLKNIYPLPDGLHFTPAMSARVLLEEKLSMRELPMTYTERVGRSKLSLFRDGFRFLAAILKAAICFRPARLLMFCASIAVACGSAIISGPTILYFREGRVEEWMIYRLLLGLLFGITAAWTLATAVTAESISALAYRRDISEHYSGPLKWLFFRQLRLGVSAALLVGAVVAVWPGLVQYATTGAVEMHWSRAVVGALMVSVVSAEVASELLLVMVDLIREQQRVASGPSRPPDRIRRGIIPSA